MINVFRKILVLALLISALVSARSATTQSNSAKELAGLWEAKKRFGPEVRGTLFVRETGDKWQAEIAGRFAPVKLEGDSLLFELPDGQGKFRGKFDARRTKIVGHWTQPQGVEISPLASPVTLTKHRGEWRGNVVPLDDALTLYLMIKERDDGSMAAFLRNPERHLGWTMRYRVDYLEREGKSIKLFAANQNNDKGRMIAEGNYNADAGLLSIYLQRGGTYEFRRVTSERTSNFYPRGRPSRIFTNGRLH